LSAGALTNRRIFDRVTVAQGGTGQLGSEVLRVACMSDRFGGYRSRRTAIYAVPNLDPIAGIRRLNPNREIDIRARFDGTTG
jgi:hypothetical protein